MGSVQVELDQDLIAILEELGRPVKEAARELIVLELYRRSERYRAGRRRNCLVWNARRSFDTRPRKASRTSSSAMKSCVRRSTRARTSKWPLF